MAIIGAANILYNSGNAAKLFLNDPGDTTQPLGKLTDTSRPKPLHVVFSPCSSLSAPHAAICRRPLPRASTRSAATCRAQRAGGRPHARDRSRPLDSKPDRAPKNRRGIQCACRPNLLGAQDAHPTSVRARAGVKSGEHGARSTESEVVCLT